MARCDLLVWILVIKFAPLYYRKLNLLLTETGRYRESPSWRKVCTCPYLTTCRFLICLKVKRHRTSPFWKHSTLQPLDELADDSEATQKESVQAFPINAAEDTENDGPDRDLDTDKEDEDDLGQHEGQTFENPMRDRIRNLNPIQRSADGKRWVNDGRTVHCGKHVTAQVLPNFEVPTSLLYNIPLIFFLLYTTLGFMRKRRSPSDQVSQWSTESFNFGLDFMTLIRWSQCTKSPVVLEKRRKWWFC